MMRGRGRGRGPPSGARPQARDDKGNIVEATQEGPPPVYPVSFIYYQENLLDGGNFIFFLIFYIPCHTSSVTVP